MLPQPYIASLAVAACTLIACATAKPENAPLPRVGDKAPDFSLVSNAGETVRLSDMRGKWVVLYFYPKNFTGGCTMEAKNFQSDLPRYTALNATIVGVSVDSVESHKEFCAEEGLTFTLLSDRYGIVSRAYGSLILSANRSARNTFVIDPAGSVAAVFTGVNPTSHSDDVLATLAKLAAP